MGAYQGEDGEKVVTFWSRKGSFRLHMLCLLYAVASYLFGYDIGVLATVYVNKGWIKELHAPSASDKGLITAIYYLGTWTSFIFVAPLLSDRLGRRYAAMVGAFIICVGSSIQASGNGSYGKSLMVVGRVTAGFGTSIVATTVPTYQSEISPAKQRGRFVVMNHIGFTSGLASAYWVGYAMSHWTNDNGRHLGWRMSIIAQLIPGLFFIAVAPFSPETPRWLIEHNNYEKARRSLAWIRGAERMPDEIDQELDLVRTNIQYHRENSVRSWTTIFVNRSLRNRLIRAMFLQFIAQMSGATAIKYYLPTNFKALGLSSDLALLSGGIESTLKIGCTIIAMMLIDRIGRRTNLLIGATVMSIALLINAVLPLAYPGNKNHAADYACIVFIFFYTFGNSIGYGPTAWVYSAEIFPTWIRARGISYAASGGSLGSIIVTQVWPIGMQNIKSRTYFIFFAFNAVSVVLIALFYPETKGLSLEEMDNLFGKVSLRYDQDREPTATQAYEEGQKGAAILTTDKETV